MNIRIGTIAAALLALSAPALTQAQESTASTLSRLIECKLSAEEVSSFVERINAEQVQDFVHSEVGGDSALILWNSETPVRAWGETSDLVNMSSTTEMHLAFRVPLGEELAHGRKIVDRIGGMSARPDQAAMEATYGWKGMDYRKALSNNRNVRVLVDLSYSPGWVAVGCSYGDIQ
ncbi:hypothetical protein D7U98_11795 [Stenotrophomonas maltophilia]|uniref:Uncharacterized protein n=1 Tax=Stenotrophomonas maltophilia (strain R551-3) TaxID=391008 RepID=B4SKT9_STRM5|nr:hypothetical protein [Stenotrophomonas maltophilia]ACF50437.1 hypothetical protein Smal_0732 [Stenotrophomonas maltophilia R551-3]MBA0396075.1 hypothetical protein [Stenotrophomonas maltophilia]QGL74805.1 hypothetical protein FEO95_03780 [Stenotrophomonas maltophilia]CCP14869.1 hypothetical protein SMRA8_0935 [Stenotrophomonas maltophilia RA8]BBO50423.1 hypothetical protein KMM349_07540 [Stenotrophomonas maltophilia]